MVEERQFSAGSVYAWGLWLLSAAFVSAALVAWFGFARMGVMMAFGLAAHAASCGAVVIHIKGYNQKTCQLIRLMQPGQPRDGLRVL